MSFPRIPAATGEITAGPSPAVVSPLGQPPATAPGPQSAAPRSPAPARGGRFFVSGTGRRVARRPPGAAAARPDPSGRSGLPRPERPTAIPRAHTDGAREAAELLPSGPGEAPPLLEHGQPPPVGHGLVRVQAVQRDAGGVLNPLHPVRRVLRQLSQQLSQAGGLAPRIARPGRWPGSLYGGLSRTGLAGMDPATPPAGFGADPTAPADGPGDPPPRQGPAPPATARWHPGGSFPATGPSGPHRLGSPGTTGLQPGPVSKSPAVPRSDSGPDPAAHTRGRARASTA
jgi:hypothetical protein